MKKIIQIFGNLDNNTLDVIKKSASSLIVKVIGLIAGLSVSIVLGRKLGPDGLGIINLANRTASILLVISMLGMENIILREVAIGFAKNKWFKINSVVKTSLFVNGGIGLIFTIIFSFTAPFFAEIFFKNELVKTPLIIAMVAMFFQVLSRIYGRGINALGKVWQSNLVDETLSIAVVGLLLGIAYLANIEISLILTAVFYCIGRIVVAITVGIIWKMNSQKSIKPIILPKKLLRMSLPLLFVNATSIIASNADTVMIGWLKAETQVGLYSVAARIAIMTSFFLQISNSAISPKLAALYSSRNFKDMEKMLHKTTSFLIIIGLTSLLFFILAGKLILNIWGNEFLVAYPVLIIIAIGQFFNIATGPAGYLLIMAGKEKIYGKISVVFLVFNLLLNFALINLWGAIGAATATAITVCADNLVKMFMAKKTTGILTIPILKNVK